MTEDLTMWSVVGARPHFVKLAMVHRAIERHNREAENCPCRKINHSVIHTGQHFDDEMSGCFYRDLNIPRPAINFGICEMPDTAMIGRMVSNIGGYLGWQPVRPDVVIVYGDTNTTLAGAIAAVKYGVPVAHIEAGARCGDMTQTEEQNRKMVDHIAKFLFAPTLEAYQNLNAENVSGFKYIAGDVLYDAVLAYSNILHEIGPPAFLGPAIDYKRPFAVATVHRQENVLDNDRLADIMAGLNRVAEQMPVVFPCHPRTRNRIAGIESAHIADSGVLLTSPVGYLEMLWLLKNANVVITDSGGVQREAYYLKTPCVVIRDRTEWSDLIHLRTGATVGTDPHRIAGAASYMAGLTHIAFPVQPARQGHAADAIVSILEHEFNKPDGI